MHKPFKINSPMKIFGFLFTLFLFTMCSEPKSRYELIREKQAEQIERGIQKDTTLLGFHFGMSKAQYDVKFAELIADGTLTTNADGLVGLIIPIVYTFPFARLRDEYFKDSLCSITLLIEGDYSQIIEDDDMKAQWAHTQMALLLLKKYPYPNCLVVESLLDKTHMDYYFFEGKQQIELLYPYLSDILSVTYSDFQMIERKEKIEEDLKNEIEKNTLKKF